MQMQPGHAQQRPKRLPRALEWPSINTKDQYKKGDDFRAWYSSYAEQTRHVRAALKADHLMTAVERAIKDNCEAHYTAAGRPLATVPLEELKRYISDTFQPTDIVYRRVVSFLNLRQDGSENVEDYCQRRSQLTALLSIDGVVVAETLERSLFVSSLAADMQKEIMRKSDWWDCPIGDLITRVKSEDKAKREQGNASAARKRQHLLVAAGGPRTSVSTGHAPDEGKDAPKSGRARTEALTNLAVRRTDQLGKGDAQLQAGDRPSQKHMRHLYPKDLWDERVRRGPNNEMLPCQSASRKACFERDRHPVTKKPWCLLCDVQGHTLATCKHAAERHKRGAKPFKSARQPDRNRRGESAKRQRK